MILDYATIWAILSSSMAFLTSIWNDKELGVEHFGMWVLSPIGIITSLIWGLITRQKFTPFINFVKYLFTDEKS